MENCDIVNLLKIRGQYLSFIIGGQTELDILDHIEQCDKCRRDINEAVENDKSLPDYGNLFQREMEDPAIPRFRDYKMVENFIDARIHWRRGRVKELMEEAEMELNDLETRL